MSDPVASRRGLMPFLALLFALGLLLRLPLIGLPLEGESAGLAARAARMAAESGWSLAEVDHRGPLLPLVLAVPIAAGASATAALRTVDALFGALLAPLACALALALGAGRRTARWTGSLLAAHPILALGAGGALAGTAGLATALLLTALLLLLGPGPIGRRVGLFLVLLLPLAEPPCAAYLPFLLVVWKMREPSARWGIAGLVLAVGVLVATPFPARGLDGDVGMRMLAWGLEWAPAALLLGLLPTLPAGALHVWRREDPVPRAVARAWLGGAAAHVLLLILLQAPPGFAFGWEGLVRGLPLVPLAVMLGLVGLIQRAPHRHRTVVRALHGVGLAASLFLVIGPLQTWVLPESTPPTGRLWRLARVVAEAEEVAGPEGWVAFDVAPALDPYEIESLGDLVAGHRAGPLATLPLEELAGDLAIVGRYRPEVLDVVTLGGRGIYRQEAVFRLGPWLVLSASRP